MTVFYACDFCGDEIEPDDEHVTLSAKGRVEDEDSPLGYELVGGYVGHYHATDRRPCWWELRELVDLVHDGAQQLESIEVASGQKIAALRRRHHHPEEGGRAG